jgi:hypothetical protein
MKKCEWPMCMDRVEARKLCTELLALEHGEKVDNEGLYLYCGDECDFDRETGYIPGNKLKSRDIQE